MRKRNELNIIMSIGDINSRYILRNKKMEAFRYFALGTNGRSFLRSLKNDKCLGKRKWLISS